MFDVCSDQRLFLSISLRGAEDNINLAAGTTKYPDAEDKIGSGYHSIRRGRTSRLTGCST